MSFIENIMFFIYYCFYYNYYKAMIVLSVYRKVSKKHTGLDQFNDWGGRGCNIFVPVLGGNGTKIAPTGDIFDQPPGRIR